MSTKLSILSNYKKAINNGFFPLLKEKGEHIDDNQRLVKLILDTESQQHFGKNLKFSTAIKPSSLEPFATGVSLCLFGTTAVKRFANLIPQWQHEYIVRAKLACFTSDCSSHSQTVNDSVVPFNHITQQTLSDVCKQFIEIKVQIGLPRIKPDPEAKIIYEEEDNSRELQEFSADLFKKRVNCHSIELIEFNKPEFKLRVVSDGIFSCRALIRDIAVKLSTDAYVTDLHLRTLGPISDTDCIKNYELHLPYIYESIVKWKPICMKIIWNQLNVSK